MLRRSSWLLVLVVGGWVAAQGQPAPILRVTPQPLEPWPQVGLDVRVLDHDGQPVENIRTDQLTVRDQQQEVGSVELKLTEAEPQSVCLVLDTSGSTYDERQAIHEETSAFVEALPEKDELCLVTFSGEPHIDAPLTMNHRQVAQALRYTRPSGGSALLDALEMAASELQAHGRYHSQAIVLVADCDDNASVAKYTQVLRDYAETGAPVVYALMLDDPSEHEASGLEKRITNEQKKDMLRLIEATGGRAYKPTSADRLASVKDLVRVMSVRYRLVYTPPSHEANRREHSVNVQLSKDLKKQKMSVDVARSYYAPGQ